MVIVELCCDHPDCARVTGVLKRASDVVHARKLIIAGDVRCPVHGVREDPLLVGRPVDPAQRQ